MNLSGSQSQTRVFGLLEQFTDLKIESTTLGKRKNKGGEGG